MRRDDIRYATFDLQQFALAPKLTATTDDIGLARLLVDTIRRSDGRATISTLAPRLTMLKGNAAERRVLLEILGVCGVLRDPEHPGYLNGFVPWTNRDLPSRHFTDTAYPAIWWRGEHGVDEIALRTFLPSVA